MGAVYEVENGAAYGPDEDLEDEEENDPEAAGAAAATAAAVTVGLGAVGRARVAVELRFRGGEGRVRGRCAVGSWLGRWVDPVCHGVRGGLRKTESVRYFCG